MAFNLQGAQQLVFFRVFHLEVACTLEGINESSLTASAVVEEQVEELQVRGVLPVGAISMAGDLEVGIGGVLHAEVGGEVPEATVVRVSDGQEPGAQLVCGLSGVWDAVDEGEAVLVDVVEEFLVVALEHGLKGHRGFLLLDGGRGPKGALWVELLLRWRGRGVLHTVLLEPLCGKARDMAIVPGHFESTTNKLCLGRVHVFCERKCVDETLVRRCAVAEDALAVVSEPEVQAVLLVSY